jgi:hypothetical protein
MKKGIVVFIFANCLVDVLVWNYAISGFKRGIESAGMGSISACTCVLNSLRFRLLPKNCHRQAIALRKCQLAGHKRAGPKTKNVSQCLQFAKIAIRQCKHGCKKRRKKKRKKRKGKDYRTPIRSNLTYLPLDLLWSQTNKRRNGNHKGFVDTSYHPSHKFTMPHVVVKFTWQSLGELVLGHQANLKESSESK